MFVDYVQVKSAGDMFEAMKSRFLDNDIIIKAAAVADYKPKSYSDEKAKEKRTIKCPSKVRQNTSVQISVEAASEEGQFASP